MAAGAQNYQNHRQYVFPFHVVLLGILLLTFIGSCVNLYKSWGDHSRIYSASLITVLTFCVMFLAIFARMFALKAQDRAIRAEEEGGRLREALLRKSADFENLKRRTEKDKALRASSPPNLRLRFRLSNKGLFANKPVS